MKMKSFLENNVEMHSTQNEGKSVVPERLIRTLKNKMFKCTTSISKNKYLDKSDDIVNKYNNTYHRTIKMKTIDVKSEYMSTLVKNLMMTFLNLKLVILLEYQNKSIFAKDSQIGLKNYL